MQKIGVSPLTNTIYLGTTRTTKKGYETWIGNKRDITNECIMATYEHLVNKLKKAEKEGSTVVEVKSSRSPYKMVVIKDDEERK